MKRKLLFSIVLCVFAGLTILNLGLAKSPGDTDTTLDLISVMAKAYDEDEGGYIPDYRCICVECPTSEDGCYRYNYQYNDNFGYYPVQICTPYTLCGWIDQHVLDVDPEACNETF